MQTRRTMEHLQNGVEGLGPRLLTIVNDAPVTVLAVAEGLVVACHGLERGHPVPAQDVVGV